MLSSEPVADSRAPKLDDLSDRQLQKLLAAAVKAYAKRQQSGGRFPAFPLDEGEPVTGTDAVIAVIAMLEATGVEIFELGLWKAWGTV